MNSPNHPGKTNNRPRTLAAALVFVYALVALAHASRLAAQDRLTLELNQYQHESDAVRKARELAKLGGLQMNAAENQLKTGDDVGSLNTLQTYLREVQETYGALSETGVDAEKKPNGYKELQISVRENLRHIDDLILTLPVDKRPFFRQVRGDLLAVQNELIDALFPRRPNQVGKGQPRGAQ